MAAGLPLPPPSSRPLPSPTPRWGCDIAAATKEEEEVEVAAAAAAEQVAHALPARREPAATRSSSSGKQKSCSGQSGWLLCRDSAEEAAGAEAGGCPRVQRGQARLAPRASGWSRLLPPCPPQPGLSLALNRPTPEFLVPGRTSGRGNPLEPVGALQPKSRASSLVRA